MYWNQNHVYLEFSPRLVSSPHLSSPRGYIELLQGSWQARYLKKNLIESSGVARYYFFVRDSFRGVAIFVELRFWLQLEIDFPMTVASKLEFHKGPCGELDRISPHDIPS